MSDQRELTVSVNKACEIVGVSRRTIYNWIHKGRLRVIHTAGGSKRIYESSLWRDSKGQAAQTGTADGI